MTDALVTLREHFEALLREKDLRDQQRYDAQDKAVNAAIQAQQMATHSALTAADKAVAKAEMSAERRFESVNEFREAYKDIIALQIPRIEAEQRFAVMTTKIGELLEALNKQQVEISTIRSRSTAYSAALAATISIMTVVMIAIALVAKH